MLDTKVVKNVCLMGSIFSLVKCGLGTLVVIAPLSNAAQMHGKSSEYISGATRHLFACQSLYSAQCTRKLNKTCDQIIGLA